jgi:hypothetical protein
LGGGAGTAAVAAAAATAATVQQENDVLLGRLAAVQQVSRYLASVSFDWSIVSISFMIFVQLPYYTVIKSKDYCFLRSLFEKYFFIEKKKPMVP